MLKVNKYASAICRCNRMSALFVFALLPILATAGDESAGNAAATSPALMLMQTMAGLLVIIALILGLAWLAKKFNVATMGQGTDLRVLSSISLGTREKAVLVEVRGEQLLLGVAPGRVTSLHVLPSTAGVSDLPADDAQAQAPEAGMAGAQPPVANVLSSEFANKLNQILKFGSKV